MSAIAFFHKLPKSALPDLNAAAVPQKRFLRPSVDDYDKYLAEHGVEAAEYPWSGYVLGPLLEYLVEKHQIDLMHSDYDELSEFVSNARGASHHVFTNAHKLAYLDRLNQPFSENDLRDYATSFAAVTNRRPDGRCLPASAIRPILPARSMRSQ